MRKVPLKILIPVFLIITLVLFYQPVLNRAGRFLAPGKDTVGDVVIVEGTDVVKRNAVIAGLNVLAAGNARVLYVLLHQPQEKEIYFALPGDYPKLVKEALDQLKFGKGAKRVMTVPVHDPITLTEARFVMDRLSREGFKKVILLSDGFHTRRSFWVYRQAGRTLGLEVFPKPCFSGYPMEGWWRSTEGMRAFFGESIKLMYYILKGYIPPGSMLN